MTNTALAAMVQELDHQLHATNAPFGTAEFDRALDALLAADSATERDPRLWTAALARLSQAWLRDRKTTEAKQLAPSSRERIASLYRALGQADVPRGALLALLARAADQASLAEFAQLAVDDPPRSPRDALQAIAPLFQLASYDPSPLFPRLFDALAEPALAAAVLDLTNFLFSQGRMAIHPAAARSAALAELLGQLVQRLGKAGDAATAADATARRAQVAESLGLAISLIHTARLTRDPAYIGKLYQALELPHRRLRVEAAAALATLKEKTGTKTLLELAAEPVVRGPALAYLEQLGQLDKVADEFKSPTARAAGRLAAWLSEPNQYGFAPTDIELLDESRQPWPGFDQPVECFLFRYDYDLPNGTLQGVGLVGPVTWAFAVDPTEISPADLYSLFAGWQAEHEEISEQPFSDASSAAWDALRPLVESLGYADLQPEKLGEFFGERHLVAQATLAGQPGTAVVDLAELGRDAANAVAWYPQSIAHGKLGPTEAYWLHKGRLLLQAFKKQGGQGA
jgi:hypothetical protein